MDKKVEKFVIVAIENLINHSASEGKIRHLTIKHLKKIHFIPIRYRIFGGLLQSMNIQFGNFIEQLLHTIVKNENHLKVDMLSNEKIHLPLTYKSDRLIDKYITERQTDINHSKNLLNAFETLIEKLFEIEKNNPNKDIETVHDIDVLFSNEKKQMFFLEVKYNDDHDTGKYVDINRKFLKTYIGLCNIKNIYDIRKFKPILYFFTSKILKGNIYVPEPEYLYRGKTLFDEFFSLKYEDLDDFMANLGENKEIKTLFDNLFHKIRNEIEI